MTPTLPGSVITPSRFQRGRLFVDITTPILSMAFSVTAIAPCPLGFHEIIELDSAVFLGILSYVALAVMDWLYHNEPDPSIKLLHKIAHVVAAVGVVVVLVRICEEKLVDRKNDGGEGKSEKKVSIPPLSAESIATYQRLMAAFRKKAEDYGCT